MKVEQIMSAPAHTCGPLDSLERAAQLLWEHDCGVLPVVDERGRVTAVITDRDICMGAYTRGKRLADVRVADCMTRQVVTCRSDEDITVAAERMAARAVRRLPVVDLDGRVRGILSINDLARAGVHDKDAAKAAGRVLAAACQQRSSVRHKMPSTDGRPARAAVLLSSNVEREC